MVGIVGGGRKGWYQKGEDMDEMVSAGMVLHCMVLLFWSLHCMVCTNTSLKSFINLLTTVEFKNKSHLKVTCIPVKCNKS